MKEMAGLGRQRVAPTCPLTSSRVSMAEPGVVAAVLTVVLGAVPEELTESISPATSWISRARIARSLARSWLILRTQGNNLLYFRRAPIEQLPQHATGPQMQANITPSSA